jgi:hypothetical protein
MRRLQERWSKNQPGSRLFRALFKLDFAAERQIRGRRTGHKCVAAGNELSAIRIFAVDGKIFGRNFHSDLAAFAGIQVNLAKAYETLGRLAGAGGKRSIDLCDFISRAGTGVFHHESHNRFLAGILSKSE